MQQQLKQHDHGCLSFGLTVVQCKRDTWGNESSRCITSMNWNNQDLHLITSAEGNWTSMCLTIMLMSVFNNYQFNQWCSWYFRLPCPVWNFKIMTRFCLQHSCINSFNVAKMSWKKACTQIWKSDRHFVYLCFHSTRSFILLQLLEHARLDTVSQQMKQDWISPIFLKFLNKINTFEWQFCSAATICRLKLFFSTTNNFLVQIIIIIWCFTSQSG